MTSIQAHAVETDDQNGKRNGIAIALQGDEVIVIDSRDRQIYWMNSWNVTFLRLAKPEDYNDG